MLLISAYICTYAYAFIQAKLQAHPKLEGKAIIRLRNSQTRVYRLSSYPQLPTSSKSALSKCDVTR